MAKLTTKARKKLPSKSFVFPKKKGYPIEDAAHARNALSRVAANGTPAQKAAVKKAVKRKFPAIAVGGAKKAAPAKRATAKRR